MATIGTILIQAANQSGSITGPNAPSIAGGGAGGGGGEASNDLKAQKARSEFEKKSLAQGEQAPKFWTAAFKKMGIQMGLAGILKQSQIFTSSIGAIFQIFGAFVDVILAPFVPLFIPAIRWLARQLPTVAKVAQWTADKISKGVSAAWNFLFTGKLWSNIGTWISDLASQIWDFISTGFKGVLDFFTDNPLTNWVSKVTKAMWDGVKGWYKNTLAGKRIAMADGGIIGKIGFTFPGGGASAATQKVNADIFDRATDEGDFGGNTTTTTTTTIPRPGPGNTPSTGPSIPNPLTGQNISIPGGQHLPFAGDDEGWEDWALAAGGGYVGAKATSMALTSAKPRDFRNPMMDDGQGGKIPKKGAGWVRKSTGFMQDWEMNPLRKVPGSGLMKMGANVITKPPEMIAKAGVGVAKNLLFGGVGDAAQVATPMGKVPTPAAPRKTPNWTLGPDTGPFDTPSGGGYADAGVEQRMPKAGSYGDDLTSLKNPTKLSRAVQAFQKWVSTTGGKLQSAAGQGAKAFGKVYDEGLKLADDVVRIAGKTPGMGFVGQSVSIGFKKVIPGIAGAYMIGETIQDVFKIIKSDAPWLGDWTSLESYKAEAMNMMFGGTLKGTAMASMIPGAGIPLGAASAFLGGGTRLAGFAQEKLGFGTDIKDWQEAIRENANEKGILSSGKLMDAIIRGGTGVGGAALSTFFPGLGTLAGTALYEGGRYMTTGLNVPGIEGTVGGNVDRYGEAQDFSEQIIAAIEAGFSRGVPLVEIY